MALEFNKTTIIKGSIWIVSVITMICGIAYSTYLNKTAFVNSNKLFQEFKMTKELEKSLKTTQDMRKKIIDSLMIEVKYAYKSDKMSEKEMFIFKQKEKEYKEKDAEFLKQDEIQTQKYNSQIWNQINSYIKEYGVKNSYTYIYGANGEGTLIYAEKSKDITNEVLKFINERYEGK